MASDATDSRQRVAGPRNAALAACAALMLYLHGLGVPDLLGDDEVFDAGLVRDVVTRGHWVLPEFNGETAPKPPLFYWLAAGVSLVAGEVSEFTVRLPSALLGASTVALTAGFGAALVGARAALLGGLFLATMPIMFDQARLGRADATMTFFVTAALLLWLRDPTGLTGPRRVAFFAFIGLAVLAKGAAGLGVIASVVVAEVLFGAGFAAIRPLVHPAAILAVALPAGWLLAGWIRGGEAFVTMLLFGENLRHFVGGGWVSDTGGLSLDWLKPTRNLFTGSLPWSLFLPAALLSLPAAPHGPGRERLARLSRWMFAGVVFFSVAARKSPYYLLPLLPAVALLTAAWVAARTPRLDPRLGELGSRYGLGFAAILLAAVLSVVAVGRAGGDGPREARALLGALRDGPLLVPLLLAGIAGVLPGALRSLGRREWETAVPRAGIVVFLVLLLAPRLEAVLAREESMRAFALEVRERAGDDPGLLFFGRPTRALAYYARRDIGTLGVDEAAPDEPFWLIVRPPFRDQLPEALRRRAEVAASGEGRAVTRSRMRVDLLRVGPATSETRSARPSSPDDARPRDAPGPGSR